jgi:acyl-coenzyme A thioesterase PaaI-like protein
VSSDLEFAKRFTHWDASSMKATGAWAERRRLASAMREVIERLVEIDAPEEELAAAADGLEKFSRRLASFPKNAKYEGWAETAPAGDVAAFFDHSPLIGLANPLSPPISLVADREQMSVEGRATFGSAFEGLPGSVHGGFVAAALDEVLGYVNSLTGSAGMTANLSIDFKEPTPLHTVLSFKARLDRTEGRKVFVSGNVHADGRLTAEAEALFVSVNDERFRDLYMRRQEREEERLGASLDPEPEPESGA